MPKIAVSVTQVILKRSCSMFSLATQHYIFKANKLLIDNLIIQNIFLFFSISLYEL
jgi:hypothetical protein